MNAGPSSFSMTPDLASPAAAANAQLGGAGKRAKGAKGAKGCKGAKAAAAKGKTLPKTVAEAKRQGYTVLTGEQGGKYVNRGSKGRLYLQK